MSSTAASGPPKGGLQRTITGSTMNFQELEGLINGANVRDPEAEISSTASSSHTAGRSNIIHIVPGKKNIKAAMRAALAEAQGYGDPNEPLDQSLKDLHLDNDASGYDLSSPNTPKRSSTELKHDEAVRIPSEPLQGAGASRVAYTESSAPPEGAGGYQIKEFVPPVVEEHVAPSLPKRQPLPNGLQRTVTGSSMRLNELNEYIEKASELECPKTPSSAGGRTPRSASGFSLASGSRASSIIQVQPGVKDIKAALAHLVSESQANSSQTEGISERQSLEQTSEDVTPGSLEAGYNPFVTAGSGGATVQRPRSIRRLMSEKSFTMDTVYSGMVLDTDLPSEPLEGTGVVSGRKYSEPKHGPQFNAVSPPDFPRVVNGVLTTSGGDLESERGSIPPSPNLMKRKSGGVHRTISGSQMDLAELSAIMEKASIPKEARSSMDSRSSTGGSTATHRTVVGSGKAVKTGSQVFGEELADEPKDTFGRKAGSISQEELQAMIKKASVPRIEPDSPRSLSSISEA